MTSIYSTGTVSVTNGDAVVTGSGTAWAVAGVNGGMFSSAGLSIPIVSVDSDSSLTLAYVWPGTTAAGVAYAIQRDNSDAANVVDLYDKLTRVLIQLSLVGIHPNNSGTLAKRDALALGLDDDNYLFLQAELGVAFAFYRWDGPSLAWIGPFPIADAVAGGGVSSITNGTGITVDSTNPAIPVIKLANMATSRVKGRATAGTGAPEDLTLSQVLDMIGSAAQGDILYRGSAAWQRLAASTAGYVLATGGAGVDVSYVPALAVKKQIFTTSGTYTPNAKMLYCVIECQGGGGGGGGVTGSSGNYTNGSGGGGGGYSLKLATKTDIGASKAVTVGGGGTGGLPAASFGGAGGASSVGSLCVANGGGGGPRAQAAVAVSGGGVGAATGTGDVTLSGGDGGAGLGATNAGPYYLGAGWGAQSFLGGQTATQLAQNGPNGKSYGGGGAGGQTLSTANFNGGNGGAGIVIITEFCSG